MKGVLRYLDVSSSGYYAFLKRTKSNQVLRKERVTNEIKRIHEESNEIYGASKITKELEKQGEVISERTVSKYMKEANIRAIWVKPYTRTTIDPDFSSTLKNILNREFTPKTPNTVLVTDITYIWTVKGFCYLTSIMDLYSRKIVSWKIHSDLKAVHVADVVTNAISKREVENPLVIHSDRGIQYVSEVYKEVTSEITRSYSEKGTPWDNACIESFHALIKREWLNRFVIKDNDHAKRLVFEYIELFYNNKKTHSYCDYESPYEYEQKVIN